VSVGAALCGMAVLLLWRARTTAALIVGAVGALLVACGLAYPPILAWPRAAWWRFSRALGHVNARVLLTLLFVLVLVPVSVAWRLTGADPLGRRRNRWRGWSPSAAPHRSRTHYTTMY